MVARRWRADGDAVPFDISFPPPSTDRCPRCDGPAGGARCGRCGLVLAGDTAQALWRIDRELHDLTVRRRELLGRLDPAPVPAPPPPPPPPSPLPTVPLGPPGPAHTAWASTRLTLANLLPGLGTA